MAWQPNLLATMITTTTYGTWLPGDLRGYVDDGVILPGDPQLLEKSRGRMLGEPVFLTEAEQAVVFDALIAAAAEFDYVLHAASVESWHMHVLISHGADKVSAVAGRLKTRMRQAVERGRIWTAGYDKRFCFTEREVAARVDYIRRHAGYRLLPVDPPR